MDCSNSNATSLEGEKIPYEDEIPTKTHDEIPYEEALDSTGHGSCQKRLTFFGGIAIMCSYIGVGAVSFILPAAQCDLEMDSIRKSVLISAGFSGIIVSCHMWGFLSDTLGRRYILIRCLLADSVLYIVTSFMPCYSMFLCLRFLQGFASCGAIVPVYAYIGELHTDRHRKRALLISALVGTMGYQYLSGLAWLVISESWELNIFSLITYKPWRLYYALLGIPGLICTAAMITFPESPKYLLAAGKEAEALEILKRIHEQNGCSSRGPFKIERLKSISREGVVKLEGRSNKVAAFFTVMWKQTVPLFRAPHRSNIALICIIQVLMYLCNNGMFLWLPETINRLAKFVELNEGKSATFCYIIQNFDVHKLNKREEYFTFGLWNSKSKSNSSSIDGTGKCTAVVDQTVFISMCMCGFGQSVIMLVLCLLSKVFSQKVLICTFVFCGFLASVLVATTQGTYILVFEMVSMIMGISAAVAAVINIVVDLFPTNIRAMAVCLNILSARTGTVIGNQVAGFLIDRHCQSLLWLFIGCLSVCIIVSFILPTKPNFEEDKEVSKEINTNA